MLQFFQLYDALVEKKQPGELIILLDKGAGDYYVNGPKLRVEALWRTTADSLLAQCKPITQEEAVEEIPGLADFLQRLARGEAYHRWYLLERRGIQEITTNH